MKNSYTRELNTIIWRKTARCGYEITQKKRHYSGELNITEGALYPA
jgi:DNA-binding PadR family transcriptional regulator